MLDSSDKVKGNTVGSRSNIDLAYIAGFLDGDGSLMLQLKRRLDTSRGWRFSCTMCFYQDTRHEEPLIWIRDTLEAGFISRRNDGMTELRINGYSKISFVLSELIPFIKFKRIQAQALLDSALLLSNTRANTLTDHQIIYLIDNLILIQDNNYVTEKKRSKDELLKMLELTP